MSEPLPGTEFSELPSSEEDISDGAEAYSKFFSVLLLFEIPGIPSIVFSKWFLKEVSFITETAINDITNNAESESAIAAARFRIAVCSVPLALFFLSISLLKTE